MECQLSPLALEQRKILMQHGSDEHRRLSAVVNRIASDPVTFLEDCIVWSLVTRDALRRLHVKAAATGATTEAVCAFNEQGQFCVIKFALLNGKPLTPRNVAKATKAVARLQ